MRFYGFDVSELTSEAYPSLSLTEDPKTTWAKTHPEFFPVDINAAPREALLRIPGIGYGSVRRILSIRRYHSLLVEDLRKLNVRVRQALPYMVTPDHLPGKPAQQELSRIMPAQLNLFGGAGDLSARL